MKTLHILNGDSTRNTFNVTNIPGDVLVWRETLSEGPVFAESEQHFFSMRASWISKAYQTEKLNYQETIIDEFDKLRSFKDYDELIFWFEFDLFCQVNLIFLLSFFKDKYPYETKISLICPNSHKNHPDFRGIGQLKPAELSGLMTERKYLTYSDILFASRAWEAYRLADKKEIKNIITSNPGNLDKLPAAFSAHLKRFPEGKSGLSHIEKLLIAIVDSGVNTRPGIYTEFWKNTAIYGMGDSQIDLYLNDLIEKQAISNVIT